MQVRINKEIQHYQEGIFMGLSVRQLLCGLLAVGTAVGLYFLLRGVIGRDTAGWVCIVAASPVAAAGFFHYNSMTLEQFAWASLRTFLMSKPRTFKSVDVYERAMDALGKGRRRRHD